MTATAPPPITEHRAADEATLAERMADDLATRLQAAVEARGRALLCVSGGRSPIPLFEALSRHPIDWARVTVSLVDDRVVPFAHDDSNAGLVHRHLLRGPAAAATWIGLVDEPLAAPMGPDGQVIIGADALDAMAARAAARLQATWPADVVVLGMGHDGHTASIFPGIDAFASLTDLANPALCAGAVPRDAPHARLTLTRRALRDARHRALQIGGAVKRDIYAQARAGADPRWPVSIVIADAPIDVWIAED